MHVVTTATLLAGIIIGSILTANLAPYLGAKYYQCYNRTIVEHYSECPIPNQHHQFHNLKGN